MTQYIDKSTLIAEIERLIDKGKYHEEYDCAYRDVNNSALYALKEIIDTLETKEVDLENAFIEKAWDWVEDNLLSSNQQDNSRLYFEQFKKYVKGSMECGNIEKFIEDFRKAMEE